MRGVLAAAWSSLSTALGASILETFIIVPILAAVYLAGFGSVIACLGASLVQAVHHASAGAILLPLAVAIVAALGCAIVFAWIVTGHLLFYTKIARGDKPVFADLYSGWPFLRLMVIGALTCGIVSVGPYILGNVVCRLLGLGETLIIITNSATLMFAVASLLWMWPYPMVVLDGQATGVIAGLTLAREISRNSRTTVLLIMALQFFATPIWASCPPFWVLAVPYFTLIPLTSYLTVTGHNPMHSRPSDTTR
ncbi:MAG: hypothetical protein FJ276_29105 [Planctomycetes bacterium]|nr:hypothetical protein [Planctomycetota bacterium]